MADGFGRPRTVGTELKQVLVDISDDEDGYYWHHRLLVVKGDPGSWIAATPTVGIQRLDLNDRHVLPLTRLSAFPPEVRGQLFHFNPAITVAELAEVLRTAPTSGMSLTRYDQNWKLRSGVAELGAVTRWHTGIIEALRFLVSIDQIDPTALFSAKQLIRDLLRIETAVSRDAKQPDWGELEVMISSAINPDGGVDVPVFLAWVSGTQRYAATILRQGRLLREERGHEDTHRSGKGDHDKQKDNNKDKKEPGGEG